MLTLACNAQAMSIAQASTAVALIVESEGEYASMAVSGHALNFCNVPSFPQWARSNLVGKSVASQQDQAVVNINGQWVSIGELLVRNGYVYDPQFADALEVAAAERRGEWACAAKDAIFQLVLRDNGTAKVVAAIAMNESKYRGYPWPWTINAQGKSLYFESREQAYHYIQRLIAAGVMSFDIGLTQINWKYHSHHFQSPWDALQPSKNIQVSNTILMALHTRLGTWEKAIKCYHNCVDQARGTQYLQNFTRQYDELANLKR